MSNGMQYTEYAVSAVLVGVVASYNYAAGFAQQALPTLGSEYLGPVAALALSITAVITLARVLRFVYNKLTESIDKRLAEKDGVILQQSKEIADLKAERAQMIREMIENGHHPTKRRPA